jgi:hypothetical protein
MAPLSLEPKSCRVRVEFFTAEVRIVALNNSKGSLNELYTLELKASTNNKSTKLSKEKVKECKKNKNK